MDIFLRLPTVLIAATIASGCVLQPREGPPAPVVRATPREQGPARPAAPSESSPAPARASETPKPVKQGTKVYAYKDPAKIPEPAAPAPAAAPQVPEQTPVAPGTDATSGAAPTAPREKPAEQTLAMAEPKTQLPAAPQTPQTPQAPQTPPAPPAASLPDSNLSAPKLPAAADALATQAERQRQAGDYAGAAASLERSLRISPREPYLWNRLARVRMEQGQSAQAGNLAARSNDLAGQSPDVKKDNWRIIAEAKRRAGDVAGATEAEQRAGAD